MSLRGASCFWRASAAAAGERGVAGAGNRHSDGVVHANEHSRLRGEFKVSVLDFGIDVRDSCEVFPLCQCRPCAEECSIGAMQIDVSCRSCRGGVSFGQFRPLSF